MRRLSSINWSARLGDVANLAILLLVVTIGIRYANTLRQQPVPRFGVGDSLVGVPQAAYAQSERTLVVQTRSTCSACAVAMPAYSKLIMKAREQRPGIRVVVVSVEEQDTGKAYLASHNIRADDYIRPDPFDGRYAVTPGLLLVDKTGMVLGSWIGTPSADQLSDMAKVLGLKEAITAKVTVDN